jgi:hypothetical protein
VLHSSQSSRLDLRSCSSSKAGTSPAWAQTIGSVAKASQALRSSSATTTARRPGSNANAYARRSGQEIGCERIGVS